MAFNKYENTCYFVYVHPNIPSVEIIFERDVYFTKQNIRTTNTVNSAMIGTHRPNPAIGGHGKDNQVFTNERTHVRKV